MECYQIQNFCPDPRSPGTDLSSLSDGRRTGSEAVLHCLPAFKPWNQAEVNESNVLVIDENFSVMALCQPEMNGSGPVGVWHIPELDLRLDEKQICIPMKDFCTSSFVPMTGHLGILEPVPKEFLTSSESEASLGEVLHISCKEPYAYAFGDRKLFCSSMGRLQGSPAHRDPVSLQCRDTTPAADDEEWYSNACATGAGSWTLAPPLFTADGGTVSLWWQLPLNETNASMVLWAATRKSCWPKEPASAAANKDGFEASNFSNATADMELAQMLGEETELNLSNKSNDTSESVEEDNVSNDTNSSDRGNSGNISDDSDSEDTHRRLASDDGSDSNQSNDSSDFVEEEDQSFAESCLKGQHMIYEDGWLQAQLESNVGRFEVHLENLGFKPGDWLHLAYAWSRGGTVTDLWLNGYSLLDGSTAIMSSTSTTTAHAAIMHKEAEEKDNGSNASNDSNGSIEELDELMTSKNETNDSNESEDSDNNSDNLTNSSEGDSDISELTGTTISTTSHNLSNDSLSSTTSIAVGPSFGDIIRDALDAGWIRVPAENTSELSNETSFQLSMGWPLDTEALPQDGSNLGWRTLHRIYMNNLSAQDVAALVSFEIPRCPEIYCPLLVSAGGPYVKEAHGDKNDPSAPPAVAVPGSSLMLSCEPGFIATAGVEYVTCGLDGAWDSLPLECCAFNEQFCPVLPQKFTIQDADGLREYPEDHWSNFTLILDPVLLPEIECHGSVVTGGMTTFGARIALMCPPGYVSVEGTQDARCAGGGVWVDNLAGGEVSTPRCELDDYWCPPVKSGKNSYLVNATAGRRLGSIAFFRCLDDENYYPDTGVITMRCVSLPEKDKGVWVDAFGNVAEPLKCKAKIVAAASGTTTSTSTQMASGSAGIISGLEGDQGLTASRRFAANATIGCGYTFLNIHGDDVVFCELGPSEDSLDGTTGRWVDKDGSNLELPQCVFRIDWCPMIELNGLHSEVIELSAGYEFGSVANIRCHMGYQMIAGNITLNCVNHESLLWGEWDASPLVCELAPFFCPAPHGDNAHILERDLPYFLGDTVNFKCNRGSIYLEGDQEVECQVSDFGYGGQWKRADGTAAKHYVCVPTQTYCPPPQVMHGYVDSLTFESQMGSVAELKCHAGFMDLRSRMVQRTAVCYPQALKNGDFRVGLSYTSRDMKRAFSLVQDILEVLDQYDQPERFRMEDLDWEARIQFEQRWRRELGDGLRRLQHDRYVRAALEKLPHYDGLSMKYLALFTTEHVRLLLRLLKAVGEEKHDLSTEAAKEKHGAFDRLKISFQSSDTLTPEGWLLDDGKLYGERSNGFSYGWKCDVSSEMVNAGAANRNRQLYTTLENTLVATDPLSRCDGQEWRIELPEGEYAVEMTIQDTEHWSRSDGCLVQGLNLGFPEKVGPPGTAVKRTLLVNVTSHLIISADEDTGCSTINRVTIQAVESVGAADLQFMLECDRIPGWCTLPEPPSHSHPLSSSPASLGDVIALECDPHYLYDYGLEKLFCGNSPDGRSGLWRSPETGQAIPNISCSFHRTWCPTPPSLVNAAIVSGQNFGVDSQLRMECRRGFRRVSGDAVVRCSASGAWCGDADSGESCTVPADWLACEAIPDYCPERLGNKEGGPAISALEANVTAGLEGANEEADHKSIVVSEILPLPAGALGDVVNLACPPYHQRVTGDVRVMCGHGPAGRGEWQRARVDGTGSQNSGVGIHPDFPFQGNFKGDSSMDDATIRLIDEASAEPVVCELETMFGSRRLYYTRLPGLFAEHNRSGIDVVPNIDQFQSDYDAAHFETNLKPPMDGDYTLSVEVIGSFRLSIDDKLVLNERSQGFLPEMFSAESLQLKKENYYSISLQYWADPLLPDHIKSTEREVERRVRFLWSLDGQAPSVVPPTSLYHSFEKVNGYPIISNTVNDPKPCTSFVPLVRGGIDINETGWVTDGTFGLTYNQGTNCIWELVSDATLRINIKVKFFDLEQSAGCAGDYLEIKTGVGQVLEVFGTYCGHYDEGEVLLSTVARKVVLTFVTNKAQEYEGFNLTWKAHWVGTESAILKTVLDTGDV